MKNLKDTATTIAGIMGAVAVGIGTMAATPDLVLPTWIKTIGVICGALSPVILGYFSGKNADGTPKDL